MRLNRWVSLRVLIGGSFIALIAVLWGVLRWEVPYWFIIIVSTPFVFAAAIFRERRIYLYILVPYIFAHIGVDFWMKNHSSLIGSDWIQWAGFGLAGEIIFQISSQRRRTEALSQRRIHELEEMNKTLMEISGELELGALLQLITERAVKLLHASLGELLLYDAQADEIESVAQYPSAGHRVGFKMKPGEGAMGRVLQTKRPLILNEYKEFMHALPDEITTGVEATLDVPLLMGSQLVGVLGVAHHEKNSKFSSDDQSLLTVFANQATIAIENARLYEEVQLLAFTDVLTGINNRRRLFELAEKEYKRSMRYRRPLSFMIADIDHFKDINDKHGHAAGDEALRWFAMECNSIIRQKVDVIGRFGGEEFAFIYPEIELPSALIAGERLRRHIANDLLNFKGGSLKITFSAGIVSLPFDEKISLDQLIERADRALYLAKQKRNCLAFWDDLLGCPMWVDNDSPDVVSRKKNQARR